MIRTTPLGLSLALLMGGCASGTEPSASLWEATLSPVAPSSVSGIAAAVGQGGRTQVSVEIRQATAGESYGWRLTTGTCVVEGPILGGAALYPVLVAGPSRGARAEAALPGELSRGGAYAVRVFRSGATGGEQVVACGALVPKS